jgi:hypothetical protein
MSPSRSKSPVPTEWKSPAFSPFIGSSWAAHLPPLPSTFSDHCIFASSK